MTVWTLRYIASAILSLLSPLHTRATISASRSLSPTRRHQVPGGGIKAISRAREIKVMAANVMARSASSLHGSLT